MNKIQLQLQRKERLMPNGIPRWIRCYDNEERSMDRYTVVFTHTSQKFDNQRWYSYVAMSEAPYHPQGFGQHGEHTEIIDSPHGKWPPAIGRRCHLGLRIRFEDLPKDCQSLVLNDYKELWSIQ